MAAADVLRPPFFPRPSPSAPPSMLPVTHQSRPFRPSPARLRRLRLERKAGDAAPAKAPELVMGKVTILKRGEAPPQSPPPAAATSPPASPARKARADGSYAGANSIPSPSPMDVPMPIGLLKNLILDH